MNDSTLKQPDKPGYYIFRGTRLVRNATYEHLHEPVAVRRKRYPRGTELVVHFFGRRTDFQLARFDGEWTPLLIESELS